MYSCVSVCVCATYHIHTHTRPRTHTQMHLHTYQYTLSLPHSLKVVTLIGKFLPQHRNDLLAMNKCYVYATAAKTHS